MGWKDAPEVDAGGTSAWQSAPEIGAEAPAAAAPKPQFGREAFQRALGLAGRSLAEGVAAPASTALGGLYGLYNVGADIIQGEGQGRRLKDPAQVFSRTLTQAGLPTPESGLEKVADFGVQTLAGAAATPLPAVKAPLPSPKLTVREVSTQKVQDAGYAVPPSLTGGGNLATDALESIGGKAAVKQQATIQNQDITDALARKAAGLGPQDEITREALKAARDEMSAPYRAVADLSPRASVALEKLKQSRHDSQVYWKSYNRSANPEHLVEAKKLDARTGVLERLIEHEASVAGTPELVDALKAARVALAKNFDVERALNTETGEISAKVIGKLADKKKITGELATVASFAKAFPQVAGEGAKTMAPGVSHVDALAAAGFGIGGSIAGIGPAAAALPLLRGPARAAVLSKWLKQKPDRAMTASEIAFRARLQSALAARGLETAGEE